MSVGGLDAQLLLHQYGVHGRRGVNKPATVHTTYRVIYRIGDEHRRVTVVGVFSRANADRKQ